MRKKQKPTIGSLARDARERAGLSQSQAAKLIGIKQPYLSEIETGKTEPSIEVLRKMAAVMNVGIHDLIPT